MEVPNRAAPPGKPDEAARDLLEHGSGADCRMCWTCGTCDLECPVNVAVGCLRPQKINRMAVLGWVEELIALPQIWYCLRCRRCNTVCPNRVKPADLIEFARAEACRKQRVAAGAVSRHGLFFARFQRVRWHAAAACMEGELEAVSATCWENWFSTPLKPAFAGEVLHLPRRIRKVPETEDADCPPNSCYTCGECSGVCPIFCERGVFDPEVIVRMAVLGMMEELIRSPSIWLCTGCGRCGDACGQRVSPWRVVEQSRALAASEGIVDREFPLRLQRAERLIYPHYVRGIDRIIG